MEKVSTLDLKAEILLICFVHSLFIEGLELLMVRWAPLLKLHLWLLSLSLSLSFFLSFMAAPTA